MSPAVVERDYTIRLEQVFQGPMDLLLHLVREQELEIHEIQIARILQGYMAYLRSLERLDIEYAADFLVMAATLMSIKSRALLVSDEIDLEQELDPRDELIQRLIEFRRFKHAAEVLEEARRLRERQVARGAHPELGDVPLEREFDLGELTAFDLLATYSRLMRETLADRPHRVVAEGRPLRYYVREVVERLKTSPQLSLGSLVRTFELDTREALIGSFCALLELVRLEVIQVSQREARGDIEVLLRPERAGDLDEVVQRTRFDEEEAAGAAPEPAVVQAELPLSAAESGELETASDLDESRSASHDPDPSPGDTR